MTDTPSVGVDALHELRAARRRRRIQDLDWFEAAYRAYLTGILGIVITLLAVVAGSATNPVDASTLADVLKYGPAAVGLVAALALGLGLRSGSRGGPLAVEAGRGALRAAVPAAPARRADRAERSRPCATPPSSAPSSAPSPASSPAGASAARCGRGPAPARRQVV